MSKYIERTYFTMDSAGITKDDLKAVCKEPESNITYDLLDMILFGNKYDWIIFEDQEVDEWSKPEPLTVSDEKKDAWLHDFGFIQKTTYDRYAKLIELYEREKDNLLNKLESTAITKFNDTPQDDYPSEGYTTNITTHSNSVDPNEMINRLTAIENKYADIYKDWVDEFSDLFGEGIV